MTPLPRPWLVLLAVVIASGIVLRFVNLDKKPFWFNEVFTALRVSGYDEHDDVNPRLYTNQVITAADIQVFQHANAEKTVVDTVRGLARKEPHLPPLYFIIAYYGAKWLNTTVLVTRGISAVASSLTLIALYWLCIELFGASRIAWLVTALAAMSPLMLYYAQEGRIYSLWLLFFVLTGAALLRAIRTNTRRDWGWYSLFLILALYTHTNTLWMGVAFGLYVLLTTGIANQKVWRFGLFSLVALIAFAPWLWIMFRGRGTVLAVLSYLNTSKPLSYALNTWTATLNRLFIAWPLDYPKEPISVLGYQVVAYPEPSPYLLSVVILALMGLSLYGLARTATRRVWLFVTLLIIVPSLPVILPDIVYGGQRFLHHRYLLPALMSLLLAVAYWLSRQLTQANVFKARLWGFITGALLVTGVVSSALTIQASTWWGLSEVDLDLADLFNQSARPLVVTDVVFGVLAPLSYDVHPNVGFLLTKQPETLTIPDGYAPVYLYQPSTQLFEAVRAQRGVTPRLIYRKQREDGGVYWLYEVSR